MASILLFTFFFFFIPSLYIILSQISRWINVFNGVVPWNWPIVGMTPTVACHFHRVHDRVTEVLEAAGSTFFFKGIWFTGLDFFFTVDPSNIHHILSSNFERYPKGPEFKYIFDVLGDGIFNSDSHVWKNLRKTALSLVRHENFLKFLEKVTMKKVNQGLIPILESASENGSVLDLQDLFQRFSFDSTCMMVTGFDLNSLSLEFPQVPFSKAMDDVEEVIFLRHFFPKRIWELQKKLQIGQARRLKQAWEIIDDTIAKLISLKRQKTEEKTEHHHHQGFDLITPYMKNKENDDKFLRDTVLNFMIAGRDTLSSALSWFFFCLSKNPTVEAKIRTELKSAISKTEESQDQWRIFPIEEIEKLVYFHGALCESLRLYPPVPLQHKASVEHDILPSGHKINPKTKILFSLYTLGRRRGVWGKDCLEFKPERWISDKGTVKHVPSYKFLAFNAGPRTCLGKKVAFTELKIVAAAIVHNYNISHVKGHHVVPNASIILHMKHGFKVRISKRWT